jgi:hypothetical protein
MSSKKITRIQIETHKITVIRPVDQIRDRAPDETASVTEVRRESNDSPKPITDKNTDQIIDRAIALARTPTR